MDKGHFSSFFRIWMDNLDSNTHQLNGIDDGDPTLLWRRFWWEEGVSVR